MNQIDLIVLLRDQLIAQPHEPYITALLRIADLHSIPVATNMATAELLVKAIERGDFSWRELIQKRYPELGPWE